MPNKLVREELYSAAGFLRHGRFVFQLDPAGLMSACKSVD
jgi:hypothetical protein